MNFTPSRFKYAKFIHRTKWCILSTPFPHLFYYNQDHMCNNNDISIKPTGIVPTRHKINNPRSLDVRYNCKIIVHQSLWHIPNITKANAQFFSNPNFGGNFMHRDLFVEPPMTDFYLLRKLGNASIRKPLKN